VISGFNDSNWSVFVRFLGAWQLEKGSFRELYKGPISNSIAVDGKFVYFTASGEGQRTGTIGRVNKTTKKTEFIVTHLNNPVQVLVDDANVYFIDIGPTRSGNITGIIGSIKK